MHNQYFIDSHHFRFMTILQLCFGLSLSLYFLGYPYTGKLFKSKSDLLLIESILGKNDTLFQLDPEKAALQKRKSGIQRELFHSLPQNQRESIENLHHQIQQSLQKSFSKKTAEGIELLLKFPKLELLWAALAILLPILLLLKKPSVLPFVWLFPLITLAYAWNNQMHGLTSEEKSLFPKDHSLMSQNSGEKKEWEEAWNQYLVTHWAKETPSFNRDLFTLQAIKGEFFFNLARLDYFSDDLSRPFWEKQSLLLLTVYLIWNTYFAYKTLSLQM